MASVGVILALVSAVPLSPFLYVLLIASLAAWAVAISGSHSARRVATSVVLTAAGIAFVASLVAPPSVARPLQAAPVFVLGDSLSAGLGTDRSETWPTLLAAQSGRAVENLAEPGARLLDGVSQADAIPEGDSIVVVELGGNDLLAGIESGHFAHSLRELLQEVRRPGRTVVMLELPLLPFQNRYGRAQWEVCAELGVGLIPRRILAGAVALPGHTTDGLHLSPQGHRWLADRIAAWL